MRAKQLKGFPVIDLDSGVMIGRVQDLTVDPASKKVIALVVGEKGLLKGKGRLIPFTRVHSIGRDAVTIEHGSRQDETGIEEEIKHYSFLGNSVISSKGDYIARVYDYTFSAATGELESLLLHDFKQQDSKIKESCLAIEGVYSFGKDYVIAAADYAAYLREMSVAEKAEPAEELFFEEGEGTVPPPGGEQTARKSAEKEETEETTVNLRSRISELWERVEREISREGKELAAGTREQVKAYVRGKRAGYTVKDSQGNFLVLSGQEITSKIINAAEAQERLAPLFFSVLSAEVEESLNIIGDRISRIFKSGI